uniref:Protein kinase domain-containing protein n=1 Tax=Globisporangium ultimum (strain ATCC 200006 / CBS 805.95 / DAOM BR144) TaxID=431595 RepID=K3WK19_GLOUD
MLDATRSVAHLRSFTPAFVHRDIKPSNFLVDFENNVKLTDFGESRCLPQFAATPTTPAAALDASSVAVKEPNTASINASSKESFSLSPQTRCSSHSVRSSGHQQLAWDIMIKGTVDYMAQEVIQGSAGLSSYGEAADVYSLGITFWDILHPGQEKLPYLKNNHLHIFEAILDGDRPTLNPENAERDADLYYVIELAWQSEPEQWLSVQELVVLLERIQERECARFTREFSYDVLAQADPDAITTASRCGSSYASESSLNTRVSSQQQWMQTTGLHAVTTMLRKQTVQPHSEAVRLGNLLMGAGVLHHVKHGRPFEDDKAASQVYYFDHNCIQMYEPPTISILEEASTPEHQRLQQPKVPVYHKVLRKLKDHGPGTATNMTTTLLLGAYSHSLTINLLFANNYSTRYDGQDGGSFTVHVQQD